MCRLQSPDILSFQNNDAKHALVEVCLDLLLIPHRHRPAMPDGHVVYHTDEVWTPLYH
jgi:hypothetical protein